MELTVQQLDAIQMVKQNRVSILTGGPGTGKTTACKEIINWAMEDNMTVRVCAPSGKAAKKISEATNFPAMTIHKLLGAMLGDNGFEFEYGELQKIQADLIICDETSMVSIDLMASLLHAVSDKTKILFVGDRDQLPSVGAGAVLRDMLRSEKIPQINLTTIHRNSGDIVAACQKIRVGKYYEPSPTLDPKTGLNLRHIEAKSENAIREAIVKLVTERMPAWGYDPIWDIQVISAMNEKTSISCQSINHSIQAVLNKNDPVENTIFCVGDKAIQTRNQKVVTHPDAQPSYVVNGDLCQIVDITRDAIMAKFFFPERIIALDRTDLHLLLAYAITCHRFQGSEAPVIIIPISSSFSFFLYRPWIYTAISRAKQICITVGQFESIKKAIDTMDPVIRVTRLEQFLNSEVDKMEKEVWKPIPRTQKKIKEEDYNGI